MQQLADAGVLGRIHEDHRVLKQSGPRGELALLLFVEVRHLPLLPGGGELRVANDFGAVAILRNGDDLRADTNRTFTRIEQRTVGRVRIVIKRWRSEHPEILR